jgi:DNA-binding GntR family transcriptional regulator
MISYSRQLQRSARQSNDVLTKQQRVYETIRERILSGTYGPGFRVVIDALAAELGASALPVREAIRRLEAEGLVVHRPHAGAQVAPADPGAFEDELTLLALLEGHASALAAPHIDETDILRLRSTTSSMGDAMERMDPLAFSRHNHDFHAVFYERCPNKGLVAMSRHVERRLDAIRRTVFTHIPSRESASIAEHRELIDLLVSGAGFDRIERMARAHKLKTVSSFSSWQREHDLVTTTV